jgi:hypothetical protein
MGRHESTKETLTMITKYDEAPEHVRKLAFSLMQLCIYRELSSSDDPGALLALGAQAGVDVPTHVAALRWMASEALKCESKGSIIARQIARSAADLYLAYASKIEATLKQA